MRNKRKRRPGQAQSPSSERDLSASEVETPQGNETTIETLSKLFLVNHFLLSNLGSLSSINSSKWRSVFSFDYPCLANYKKNWVQNWQMCIQNKRIKNDILKTELLNCSKWGLGPEDVLQMDILPNLPPSGGFDSIITAIDVFSRYLFPCQITRITAPTLSRVILDIICVNTQIYQRP